LLAELPERHINAIQNGSGLVLRSTLCADLNVAEFTSLSGGSHVPLPDFAERKQRIIHIKSGECRCLGYSVLATLLQNQPQRNRQRAAHYHAYFAQCRVEKLGYKTKHRALPSY
jgi:hypothetical protein